MFLSKINVLKNLSCTGLTHKGTSCEVFTLPYTSFLVVQKHPNTTERSLIRAKLFTPN